MGVSAATSWRNAGGMNFGSSRKATLPKPSHHSTSNGLPPLAFTPGKVHVTCDIDGQNCARCSGVQRSSETSAVTVEGLAAPSSMPSHTGLIKCRPRSPSQEVPKSRHLRQFSGW